MKQNDVNICLKRHGCMNYDLLTCMGFFTMVTKHASIKV